MNKLIELLKLGQSYWLDNLSRTIIQDGTLKRMVGEEGLRGITSNPSIFKKAILGSDVYDDQIRELIAKKKSVQEIYEALTVKDVQDACDLLRSVYDESNGLDGFVSLEVSPLLARDTTGTISEVGRLWDAVGRENCMIKIPATREGLEAIEECLYQGININITLIFSAERYEEVAQAFQNALERRRKEGKQVPPASVASVFISRIDVLVDEWLAQYFGSGAEGDLKTLVGKTGIATAKRCYEQFQARFGEKEPRETQRLLWASTSNKNPLFHDNRYVDTLIAKQTINTLPNETIRSFQQSGVLKEDALNQLEIDPQQFFKKLLVYDIDRTFVSQQLENEGIAKFNTAYRTLMEGLARKRENLLHSEIPTLKVEPGKSKSDFDATCTAFDEFRIAERLFNQDATLWKSNPEDKKAILERLGWLALPSESQKSVNEIESFAKELSDEQFQHVILLGMGGSSLSSEVARSSFQSKPGFPTLFVLDNTSQEAILSIEEKIDLRKAFFIVASKSGGTAETLGFFRYFYEKVKTLAGNQAGEQFAAITDPGTKLIDIANEYGFRKVFESPEDVGGRYSVLSVFGLLPMATMGIDIKEILDSAQRMKESSSPEIPTAANPSFALGALLGACQKQGRDKVTLLCSQSLATFGYWAEQLIAESTGKEHTGFIPINDEEIGTVDVYGADRVFIEMRLKGDHEQEDKVASLVEAGYPVVRIELNEKNELGALFYLWELAVAAGSVLLKINPFDQPNVERSKEKTRALLKEATQSGQETDLRPVPWTDDLQIAYSQPADADFFDQHSSLKEAIADLLEACTKGTYFGLLPYLFLSAERSEILQQFRLQMRDRYQIATTLLEGPRYLHSTGQMHKGGPDTGVFLMLTCEEEGDLEIPGQEFSFKTLDLAEATGDFLALKEEGRRVIRVHFKRNLDKHLKDNFL